MYISSIHIKGYRGFKDQTINFHEGMNVIIAPNNGGKSNLLKALGLVIDHDASRRLDIYDFCRKVTFEELKDKPPMVEISITMTESEEEGPEDLVMVRNCLTKLERPYEARMTYRYYLADKEKEYHEDVATITKKLGKSFNENDAVKEVWNLIRKDYLRYYSYTILAGDPNHGMPVDQEIRNQFDFQYLEAIRDVERDLFTGRDSLLKEVLDFFIDYDVKTNKSLSVEEKKGKLKALNDNFQVQSTKLISFLQDRIRDGKEKMLGYANKTGASSFQGAQPDFEGSLTETDLFSALQLIIKYETGIEVSATHNGLGYNNLIYISLLLSRMQAGTNGDYMGINAKLFPVLALEEPEAHLHPSLQYKFLSFLKQEIKEKSVRQMFITTHSTHITSSVGLDDMICLYGTENTKVAYPGKLFVNTQEGRDAKAYVERFLDVIKSNILFADKVIFVEGLAEQILVPSFAKLNEIDLDEEHIAVVAVGNRDFEKFLYLFDTEKNPNAIDKKVACIVDMDPVRKDKTKDQSRFEACYPYELNQDDNTYEYEVFGASLVKKYEKHPNIRYFSQDEKYGKTLEYELMRCNSDSDLLISEDLSNMERIKYIQSHTLEEGLGRLGKWESHKRIKDGITNCKWSDEEKKHALLASLYLQSLSKGINALELSRKLTPSTPFNIPSYIKDAIEWVRS